MESKPTSLATMTACLCRQLNMACYYIYCFSIVRPLTALAVMMVEKDIVMSLSIGATESEDEVVDCGLMARENRRMPFSVLCKTKRQQ